MVREDPEACQLVKQSLEDSGVQVLTGHNAIRFSNEAGEKYLHVEHEGEEKALPFDAVLVAVGRQANTDHLGLETLALPTDPDGTIQTNELLQSRYPNIYACGDVAGPYQFTHTAAHQAWYAAVNALFGFLKSFKVDYRVIPWCTFTSRRWPGWGSTNRKRMSRVSTTRLPVMALTIWTEPLPTVLTKAT